ncbi:MULTISPECIES: hypothetical protein [Streptomyces]|uniref:Uncharacterized protein n=1 Tax=Streptomyces radiopugnans TaxID=403935 RepID=A0A1H9BJE5_9ACTN|nr:hypothetical protein [Streptomyces radiopugnans]URN14525.1 hypothetical protein LUW77_04450 [Streptomyces radiopugnans]SEP88398.1 hypothetical protein SAMN05216481_102398 [Streptomyces radiopugnans]
MKGEHDKEESSAPRPTHLRTGSEQPVDPEDLVMLSGREPTPERIEKARRELEEHGAAAVEKYLP